MGCPPLSINIAPKDQRQLGKLLSGGVQQVRVVLRALALLQLAKGASPPVRRELQSWPEYGALGDFVTPFNVGIITR